MTKQNDELIRVKLKIKALAAKTLDNGCTEHEAMTAATKVGELLEQYNLSMSECDVRQERCIQKQVGLSTAKWQANYSFIMTLAKFCDLKIWSGRTGKFSDDLTKYNRERTITFFGLEPDVEMAEYLTNVILSAMRTSAKEYKQTDCYQSHHKKSKATRGFKIGFSDRIVERLQMMQTEKNLRAKSTGGTALIVLKGQLVNDEFEKLGMKLRTSYSYRRASYSGQAYAKGLVKGNSVNLSRPVSNQSGLSGYLT
jgi:hypothetical protein